MPTTHIDADSPAERKRRDGERAKEDAQAAAQASRGRPPEPTRPAQSREAEIAALRARIAEAERRVEGIHGERSRARQRATEKVNAAETRVGRVKACSFRNVTVALAALDRLVASCADDAALDAATGPWLRRLQVVDGLPPLPPADAVTRWLLGQPDSPLAAALRASVERGYAATDGSGFGLSPQTSAELAAERAQADAELADARQTYDAADAAYNESAAVLSRHMRGGGDGDALFRFLDHQRKGQ
jgi:hypothetical protein